MTKRHLKYSIALFQIIVLLQNIGCTNPDKSTNLDKNTDSIDFIANEEGQKSTNVIRLDTLGNPFLDTSSFEIQNIKKLTQVEINTAQKEHHLNISWEVLKFVNYVEHMSPQDSSMYLYPKFANSILNLHGKKIKIHGYVVLPMDEEGKYFAISAVPNSSCFFCGKSGPESVMGIRFKNKKDYKIDQLKTFKGVLQINGDDVDELMYTLLEAEESEE